MHFLSLTKYFHKYINSVLSTEVIINLPFGHHEWPSLGQLSLNDWELIFRPIDCQYLTLFLLFTFLCNCMPLIYGQRGHLFASSLSAKQDHLGWPGGLILLRFSILRLLEPSVGSIHPGWELLLKYSRHMSSVQVCKPRWSISILIHNDFLIKTYFHKAQDKTRLISTHFICHSDATLHLPSRVQTLNTTVRYAIKDYILVQPDVTFSY